MKVSTNVEFRITEDNVKKEWSNQAALYWEYSSKLVKATNDRNVLCLNLETLMAYLDISIRKKPEKYFGKGGKQTEAGIRNLIVTDGEYLNVKTLILKAEKEVGLLTGLLKSLEQRKKSLEFYGQLYIQSLYSSEPKESSFVKSHKKKGGE